MSERFFQYAVGTSAGSLSPRTNWSSLANFEFDLPSPELQHRIGEILWAVDKATERYLFSLGTARIHNVAVLEDQFSENHSRSAKLVDLCGTKGIRIGPFGSQLHACEYVDQGIPVVMPANLDTDEVVTIDLKRVSDQKASELSVHKLEEGDILLPRRGNLGKRGFVYSAQKGWICGTGTVRIRIDEAENRRLLFYALSRPSVTNWLGRNAVGTTMSNLSSTIVGNIQVVWPKDPKRCQRLISETDTVIKTLQDHISHAKRLLQTFTNAALSKGLPRTQYSRRRTVS